MTNPLYSRSQAGRGRVPTATRMILGLVLVVLAGSTGASGSSAASLSGSPDHFYSPTGNIECHYLTAYDPALGCLTFNNQQLALINTSGDLSLMDGSGDTDFQPGSSPVLAYGRRWSNGTFTCISASSGMRCTSAAGPGFTLNATSVTPYPGGKPIKSQALPQQPSGATPPPGPGLLSEPGAIKGPDGNWYWSAEHARLELIGHPLQLGADYTVYEAYCQPATDAGPTIHGGYAHQLVCDVKVREDKPFRLRLFATGRTTYRATISWYCSAQDHCRLP
jgi:hypothetical protein